ncbi:unnamed protein product [Closterium sp. NIES-53]
MYLMTCTRPDLAYPLSILARYVAPGRHRPEHMAAAKRVLRYLCSTSGLGLVLGGRRPVVLTGHADASWADDQATQRSSQGYTFSLGSGSVSWRSTHSSFVLGSSCEAEINAGAMAAQELRWLTYLLTDLGEQPRSPPVLYVDHKAMLALCREHSYFLARELQQRGQLRLAYVASEANTADIFTKALPPGDHQPCFALLDWSCFPTCTQLISSSIIPVSSHASRPASPVRTTRTSRRAPRPRPPELPSIHQMTLRPSTAPLRVPLPSPPASSLPVLADPASDSLRAASPTSASVCPPSVGGECALSTDVLEDRQEEFQCFVAALPHLVSMLIAPEGDPDAPDIPTPRSYAEAIEGPYSSQWQSAMDAEMASWKSTGTYVDAVPPPGANIVSGMWIFRVKRPPGSPPVFNPEGVPVSRTCALPRFVVVL